MGAHTALQPEHAAGGLFWIVSYSQGDECDLNAVCAVIQNQLCVIVLQYTAEIKKTC